MPAVCSFSKCRGIPQSQSVLLARLSFQHASKAMHGLQEQLYWGVAIRAWRSSLAVGSCPARPPTAAAVPARTVLAAPLLVMLGEQRPCGLGILLVKRSAE